MFESIANFFKNLVKSESKETVHSKDTAKERLHLVLMQDRANVSADFLELMKHEIIEVIKKYIEVEETAIDVRLTNEIGDDGTKGAPSLYANIPIVNIKNSIKKEDEDSKQVENEKQDKENIEKDSIQEDIKEEIEKQEDNSNKEEDKKEVIEKEEVKKANKKDTNKTSEKKTKSSEKSKKTTKSKSTKSTK